MQWKFKITYGEIMKKYLLGVSVFAFLIGCQKSADDNQTNPAITELNQNKKLAIDLSNKALIGVGTYDETGGIKKIVVTPGKKGLVLFGPYLPLQEGSYAVKFYFDLSGPANVVAATVDFTVIDKARNVVEVLKPTDVIFTASKIEQAVELSFKVPSNKNNNLLYEFRVTSSGAGSIVVKQILLTKNN
jgi:hypothetical protein